MASEKKPSSKKGLKKGSRFPLLALALIAVGSAVLLFGLFKPTNFLNPSQEPLSQSQVNYSKASKIYILKIDKFLSVEDGTATGNRWTVSKSGVSFLTTSALPGAGNTVLYGHNRKEILGDLSKLEAGNRIYLILQNGDFTAFEVIETKDIKPTQVEILNPSTEPILTIYTCSGFLDQSRFVAIAKKI